MKRIVFIISLLVSIHAGAQLTPTYLGGPNSLITARGPLRSDSSLGNPLRDTTFTPYSVGIQVFRTADASVYVSISITAAKKWSKLAFSAGATTWGSITGTLSSQADLVAALALKQNVITTGTTAQYIRGDLSLANFSSAVTAVGDPIYAPITHSHIAANISDFTTASRALFSAGTGMSYNPATGVFSWTGSGSGISSLNGLTGTTQTFALGTSGTNINISSVGTAHTFNFPTASATARGALSSADWSTFNSKVSYTDALARAAISLTTTGTSGAATYNNTTGVLNIPVYSGGGVTTMANIGSTPNADGASISGSTLTLQPASGSFGGVVTTGAQTFAGTKTFSNNVISTGFEARLSGTTYGSLGWQNSGGNTWGRLVLGYNSFSNNIISQAISSNANIYLPNTSLGTDTLATLSDVRAGGGSVVNTNIANANLTSTANRTHDFGGFFQKFNNLSEFELKGTGTTSRFGLEDLKGEQGMKLYGNFSSTVGSDVFALGGSTGAPMAGLDAFTASAANYLYLIPDSARIPKRISYTHNIHGTFTDYSLITKKYMDSVLAAEVFYVDENHLADDGSFATPLTLVAPTVTPSTSTSLTLTTTGTHIKTYVFTGSSAATWTLPALGTTGKTLKIKNRGSANVIVQRAGSDQIYTTTTITSITMYPGDELELQDDGTFWNYN